MIKPSPELLAITRRFGDAVLSRDAATLMNLFTEADYLRYVGSAENEIWGGPLFREGYARHNQEVPDSTYREVLAEAFEAGAVGWSLFCAEIHFLPVDRPFMFRLTFVFTLEAGAWKIAQAHVSSTVSNREIMGFDHTALDDLVQAAQSDFQTDQREGTATVMFTDIANSSAIAENLGDRIWAATVQSHIDAVTEIITGNTGSLVKSLGDGTMSTFASARAAMNAALSIQSEVGTTATEPRLHLRIGIHTGDVVQTEDDFFGTVVNKAARIAAAAQPEEIRVSQASQIMVGNEAGFRFTDAATVSLKGLDGDHQIFRLETDPRHT